MNKELLEKIDNMIEHIAINELHTGKSEDILIDKSTLLDIKKELELQSVKEANPSEALECLGRIDKKFDEITDCKRMKFYFKAYYNTIKQALLKAQEQEKENELLKEIIKSLFDRGCPLHQYIDKDGVLQIEVDDECSNMRLGEYKGVDLDKKLKEILK